MFRTTTKAFASVIAASVFALSGAAAQEAQWYPLPFDGKTVAGEEGRFEYTPLSASGKASKPWNICVALPHLKDPFFLAMNYGMVEEAKLLGVQVQSFDAGGYTQLANQISQIENCVAGGADAVVLVAIANEGMGNLLAELKARNIPVIDSINGVASDDTAVRVLTSPRDEGYRAAKYLAEKHPAGSDPVNIVWLPGPAGAGFVEAFNAGFEEGLQNSAVTVVEAKYGDVGKEVQGRLVEDLLQSHTDLDYIVGTAVMVEAALPLLRARGIQDDVKLVSVYTTPGVYEMLKAGQIEAAGAAPVTLTARVILDQAVRVLEDQVEFTDVGALGDVYTVETIGTLDPLSVMAPRAYRPNFAFRP